GSSDQLAQSGDEIERLIMAYIMRQCGNENFFYEMYNSSDTTYLRALQILEGGRAWPQIEE
ncbi:MAG: hypothetical protein J6W47_04815, partial [Bacteroidales bacterium]|nr:hypothetical protein [Bacteroidales bacterium]